MDSEFHLSQKPFGQISSSIGPLSLFEITSAGQAALNKELGKRVDQCGPEEYVRRLARYICFPAEQIKMKGSAPAGPVFTMNEIEDLSDTDLEVFAALYIQNHPALYRKFESERTKDKDGNAAISWKLGDVLYPKEDDESFTRYLHRLTGLKQAREIEQAEKQAALERARAAASAAAPVPPPAPLPEVRVPPAAVPAGRIPPALFWLGIAVVLISLGSLTASLSALALARHPAPPARELPADINLNINVELARIADLLSSLRQARETSAPPAEINQPPDGTAGAPPPADEEPPVPNTMPLPEELRTDCIIP